MNTFYTILTDAGISTIISARANESEIKLSKMAVGDGVISPSSDMTTLLSEKYRFDIRSITQDRVNPNHLIVEGVIPIDIGGFNISEIAIYTEDETLFAIGNLPKTYKPQPEEGSAKELTIQVITEVTNVDSVNISVVTSDLGVFKSEIETIKSEVNTITTTLDTKVDKVEGKGLSSNDFTDEYKDKLTNLSSNFKTINNESILGEGNIELIGSAHRSWYLEKTNSSSITINDGTFGKVPVATIIDGDEELSTSSGFKIPEDGKYLISYYCVTYATSFNNIMDLEPCIYINDVLVKTFNNMGTSIDGGGYNDGNKGFSYCEPYRLKKDDVITFGIRSVGGKFDIASNIIRAKLTSVNTQNALSLANYYSKEEVDTKINEIETGSTDLSDYYTKEQVDSNLETKQDLLLSGENLSTINGQSLLNGGDITIESTNIDDVNQIITTDNSYSILNNKLIVEGEPITKTFKDNVEFDSVKDNYIWKENDVVFLENVANSWFDIDYYIAPDGDDTNGDGSYDNPWKTFANVPLNCIAGLKAGQYKTSSYGYYATNGNFNSTHGLFKGLMKVEHAHAETRPANANPIMTDSNLKALLAAKNSGYNNYTKATLIVSENKDALVEIIYDTNSSQRDKGIFTNMGLGDDLFVFKNLTFRRPINGGTNYSNAILRADSPITGLLIEECIFDFAGQPYSYNYIPGGAWVPIYNRCKFNGSLQANYSGTQVIINDSTINCINYFDGTHPINCYKYINGEFVIYNNLNYTKIEIDEKLDSKVDKIDGMGLSTNDFTDEYKAKLDELKNETVSLTKSNSSDKTVYPHVSIPLGGSTVTIPLNVINTGDNRLDNIEDGFKAISNGIYTLDATFNNIKAVGNPPYNIQNIVFYIYVNNIIIKQIPTGGTVDLNKATTKSINETIELQKGDIVQLKVHIIPNTNTNGFISYSTGSLVVTLSTDTLGALDIIKSELEDLEVSVNAIKTEIEDISMEPTDLSNYYDKTEVDEKLDTKVDKVEGKGLSTNDFTDLYKDKIDEIITNISLTKNNLTGSSGDAFNGNVTYPESGSSYRGVNIDIPLNNVIIGNEYELNNLAGGFKIEHNSEYDINIHFIYSVLQEGATYSDYNGVYRLYNIVVNGTIVKQIKGNKTGNSGVYDEVVSDKISLVKGDIVTLNVFFVSKNNSSSSRYSFNANSCEMTLSSKVIGLSNKADRSELDKKVNATDLVTINNQPLTNGGNIQVARETALINMGIKYYNKVADVPNTDVGNQGIITGDFFFREDSDTLSIDNFVTNNKSRLILTAGKTYNINIRINKTETSLQSKHLLCILEDIETATRKDIGNVYSVMAGNLRQILVDRQVTIEKDCYLYIVQNGGYITTPTTLNINITEYSPSAEGYVDLNNLSTLSSPKLGEEVLTEYRHPVSEKPLYSKYLLIGNTNTTGITNSYNWNSYIKDLEDVDSTRTIITLYNTTLVTYYTLPVYDINGDGVYTGLSNTSIWFRAKGTTFLNMPVYAMLYYTKTTDTADSPVRLVGSAQNIYKLNEEIKTNDIWISGKPIYRKTIDFGNLTNTSEKRVSTGLTNVEDCWINMNNSYFIGDNNRNYPLMLSSSDTGSIYSSVDHNGSAINITTAMNRTGWKAIVTINYTKTTDEVAN